VLAGEIARAATLEAAFAAYDAAMRPMVEQAQGIPKLGPRLMNPHSRPGIGVLHAVLKLASRPGLQRIAARLMAASPPVPDLSRYA
ncbi:FAD-binding monooxygenase, partial [Xanthomonas sp. Kuri4-1]